LVSDSFMGPVITSLSVGPLMAKFIDSFADSNFALHHFPHLFWKS
jgi:hypothetical protein